MVSRLGEYFIKHLRQTKNASPILSKKRLCSKKAPDRIQRSVKDEYFSIRGATLIHGIYRALSRIPTYPRQLTYAHTSQNTQHRNAVFFDCALSGPFDNLGFARLPPAQTLCEIMITVISASTVCNLFHLLQYSTAPVLVKRFFQTSVCHTNAAQCLLSFSPEHAIL